MTSHIVSFSELNTVRQCSLKHQLDYIERWTKQPAKDSPLTRGTMWHAALDIHYNTIKAWQEGNREQVPSLAKACESRVEAFLETQDPDLADLVWWMYLGYVEKYGHDRKWKILAVEHAAQCRLPTLTGRPSNFILKMKIDLIVADISRAKPQIWVIDHKSCRNLPKGKELDLDDQFGLYTWGLRQMGKQVFGQIHSAARTERLVKEKNAWEDRKTYEVGGVQPLDERFLRTPMARSDKELDVLAVEAYQAFKERYRQQREIDRANKSQRNRRFESPRSTNPDTCKWKCDKLEPCLAARRGLDLRQYLRDKEFVQDFDRH